MPKKGLPYCQHTDGTFSRSYWLIKDGYTRYLIECKVCGKQRWSRSRFTRHILEQKPIKENKHANNR